LTARIGLGVKEARLEIVESVHASIVSAVAAVVNDTSGVSCQSCNPV
jgi:hypothetical protein